MDDRAPDRKSFRFDESDTLKWLGIMSDVVPSFPVAGSNYRGIVCTDFLGCLEHQFSPHFWIPTASDIAAMEPVVQRCFNDTNCLKEAYLVRYGNRWKSNGGEQFRVNLPDTLVTSQIRFFQSRIGELAFMPRTYVGIFHEDDRQIFVTLHNRYGSPACPPGRPLPFEIRFRYDVETEQLHHMFYLRH